MKTHKIKTLIAALALAQSIFLGAAQARAATMAESLRAGASLGAAPLRASAQAAAPAPSAPAPAAAGASGRSQTSRPSYGSYSGTLIAEPDDGRAPVLDLINSAQRSIDVTIYTISDSQIVNALVAAEQRGVAVRVIYNYNSFAKRHIYPNDKAANAIINAGGQARQASSAFAITHQKTITVDGTTSLIMTFNLSTSYFSGTRDFGYVTTDPAQVGEIENVFQADWDGSSITPSESSLVWSPDNSRSKILNIIDNARTTLLVDNEETSDAQCMNALIAAARRGVSVRFLTAVLSSYSGSGTDGNAKERDVLNQAGVQAKAASNYYMHGKMLLADYGTSYERGFIGSENFSSTSLDKNRELGVILTDQDALRKIDGIFESDWSAN